MSLFITECSDVFALHLFSLCNIKLLFVILGLLFWWQGCLIPISLRYWHILFQGTHGCGALGSTLLFLVTDLIIVTGLIIVVSPVYNPASPPGIGFFPLFLFPTATSFYQ